MDKKWEPDRGPLLDMRTWCDVLGDLFVGPLPDLSSLFQNEWKKNEKIDMLASSSVWCNTKSHVESNETVRFNNRR
jgi:hypothetical protein